MRKPPSLERQFGESRPATPRPQPRRFWSRAILFAASVLLMNGLFGDRGFLGTLRARRAFATATRELSQLRLANTRLREQARRLRSDPATIESVAREDFGFVRPGEILVTIRDLRPGSQ